jgi:hypothetical protein
VLAASIWLTCPIPRGALRKDQVVLARASQPHPTEANSAWARRKRLIVDSWLHGRPARIVGRDI